jgi:hypothetical protein
LLGIAFVVVGGMLFAEDQSRPAERKTSGVRICAEILRRPSLYMTVRGLSLASHHL